MQGMQNHRALRIHAGIDTIHHDKQDAFPLGIPPFLPHSAKSAKIAVQKNEVNAVMIEEAGTAIILISWI